MPTVDLGTAVTGTWRLGVTGATVAVTVTLPDGSTDTPETTDGSAGTYTATLATPQPGRYLLSWSATGATTATYTDVVDVWPADPRFIISLEDARAGLRLPSGNHADDASLRLYVAAATVVIEDIAGEVLVDQVTQTGDGGKTGIALWSRPSSVDSVTVNDVALADDDYVADLNAGIVYAGGRQNPRRFPPGRQNIAIAYQIGSTTISPNIRLAARELIRHWWQQGQQSNRPAFGNDPAAAPMATTPSGFAVPNRVIELCAPAHRLPGIA